MLSTLWCTFFGSRKSRVKGHPRWSLLSKAMTRVRYIYSLYADLLYGWGALSRRRDGQRFVCTPQSEAGQAAPWWWVGRRAITCCLHSSHVPLSAATAGWDECLSLMPGLCFSLRSMRSGGWFVACSQCARYVFYSSSSSLKNH
jgi:hypothetical protein